MEQPPPNGKPRHLDPTTAIMPAIRTDPKHAYPDTGELNRTPPPVPLPPTPATVRPTTRQERREAASKRRRPWWKFWEVE